MAATAVAARARQPLQWAHIRTVARTDLKQLAQAKDYWIPMLILGGEETVVVRAKPVTVDPASSATPTILTPDYLKHVPIDRETPRPNSFLNRDPVVRARANETRPMLTENNVRAPAITVSGRRCS